MSGKLDSSRFGLSNVQQFISGKQAKEKKKKKGKVKRVKFPGGEMQCECAGLTVSRTCCLYLQFLGQRLRGLTGVDQSGVDDSLCSLHIHQSVDCCDGRTRDPHDLFLLLFCSYVTLIFECCSSSHELTLSTVSFSLFSLILSPNIGVLIHFDVFIVCTLSASAHRSFRSSLTCFPSLDIAVFFK